MEERIRATTLKPNQFLIDEPHTCFHCGNTGLLKYIGKAGWMYENADVNDFGIVERVELFEHEDWYIFECPVCHKPILISEYCIDIAGEPLEVKTEFPTISVSKEGVPKEIFSSFESAVKTKGIDFSICLLSLRRVLEMICKDKGAKGRTLEKKLEYLV